MTAGRELLLALAVIAGVLLLLGAVFTTIGVWRRRWARGRVRVPGAICGRDGELEGFPAWYPTFQWHGPDGTLHRHTSSVYGGLYPMGRHVTVLVDPADPSRGQLEGLVQGGQVFLVVGVGLLLLGLAS